LADVCAVRVFSSTTTFHTEYIVLLQLRPLLKPNYFRCSRNSRICLECNVQKDTQVFKVIFGKICARSMLRVNAIDWWFRTEATAWWSRRCLCGKRATPASVPIRYTLRTALPWQPLTLRSAKVRTVIECRLSGMSSDVKSIVPNKNVILMYPLCKYIG